MAATFDGVDDNYELAGETTLRYEYTQPFSGHAWILKSSVTGLAIMGKAQNSPPAAQQRGWAFNTEVIGGNLGISFHLVNNGSSAHAFKQAEVLASGVTSGLQPGLWVPVGFTYDGSGLTSGMKLYCNGSVMTTSGTPVDTLGGNTILVNGVPVRLAGFDTEFWDGTLSGVVIVPAELNATEMAALGDIRNIMDDPSTFLSTPPDVWVPLPRTNGVVDLNDYSGNGHTASVGTGAPAVAADPEVVFDTFNTGDITSTGSFTLTPNGHVEAVAALIVQNASSSDLISGVTHGGVALTRIPVNGFAQDTSGEAGAAYLYLLNSGVLQGAQTLEATVASGTNAKRVWGVTINSVGRVKITDSGKVEGDTANPSVTFATAAPWTGLALNVCFSGQNAPGSLTAGAGYIKLGGGRDFGSQSAVAEAGSLAGASVASGWTATSEDVAMIALALQAMGWVPKVMTS